MATGETDGIGFAGLSREQRSAVLSFLRACTVPIVAEIPSAQGPRANVVGTGTLFDFGTGPYLITTNHVLQGSDWGIEHLAIPEKWSGPGMQTLGSFGLRRERQVDVAIFRLENPDVVARMRQGWNVLDGRDIEAGIGPGEMAVAGVPRTWTRVRTREKRGPQLVGGWIAAFLNPYVPAPDEDPSKGLYAYPGDLLAKYPKKVVAFDESVVNEAPDSLEGLSGGSVWRYAPVEQGGFWAVQKAMQIVGIQISQENQSFGRFVRVRSWAAVSRVYYHPETTTS
jgi:hypothetical protein